MLLGTPDLGEKSQPWPGWGAQGAPGAGGASPGTVSSCLYIHHTATSPGVTLEPGDEMLVGRNHWWEMRGSCWMCTVQDKVPLLEFLSPSLFGVFLAWAPKSVLFIPIYTDGLTWDQCLLLPSTHGL